MAVLPTPLSLKKKGEKKRKEKYPLKNKRYPLKYVVGHASFSWS